MQNVVSFRPDRPRPARIPGVPREGARILFFTGVRYCRDEDAGPAEPALLVAGVRGAASERVLDAATH